MMADPFGVCPSGVSIGERCGRAQRWGELAGGGREGGGAVMSKIQIPLLVMWSGLMVALWGLWSFHEEEERRREDAAHHAYKRSRQVATQVAQRLLRGR
jgi:hypothetical protein